MMSIDEYELPFISHGEKTRYLNEFSRAGPKHGYLEGKDARSFFFQFCLPNQLLAKIWELSDVDGNGSLMFPEFALAMFLIHAKLKGTEIPDHIPEQISKYVKRCLIDEYRKYWAVPATEKKEYDQVFASHAQSKILDLPCSISVISGDAARGIFLKSRLSSDVLRQIWNLVDTRHLGWLDAYQFATAMYLINQVLRHRIILPESLPEELVPPSQRPIVIDATIKEFTSMKKAPVQSSPRQASSSSTTTAVQSQLSQRSSSSPSSQRSEKGAIDLQNIKKPTVASPHVSHLQQSIEREKLAIANLEAQLTQLTNSTNKTDMSSPSSMKENHTHLTRSANNVLFRISELKTHLETLYSHAKKALLTTQSHIPTLSPKPSYDQQLDMIDANPTLSSSEKISQKGVIMLKKKMALLGLDDQDHLPGTESVSSLPVRATEDDMSKKMETLQQQRDTFNDKLEAIERGLLQLLQSHQKMIDERVNRKDSHSHSSPTPASITVSQTPQKPFVTTSLPTPPALSLPSGPLTLSSSAFQSELASKASRFHARRSPQAISSDHKETHRQFSAPSKSFFESASSAVHQDGLSSVRHEDASLMDAKERRPFKEAMETKEETRSSPSSSSNSSWVMEDLHDKHFQRDHQNGSDSPAMRSPKAPRDWVASDDLRERLRETKRNLEKTLFVRSPSASQPAHRFEDVFEKESPRSFSGPSPREAPTTPLCKVRALFNFEAQTETDVSFHKDDLLCVLEKPETRPGVVDGWWFGHLVGGRERGWFPANYVEEIDERSLLTGITYRALYDYENPAKEDELTLKKGQLLTVLQKELPGWWLCESNGHIGYAPENYLESTTVDECRETREPTLEKTSSTRTTQGASSEAIWELIQTEETYFQEVSTCLDVFYYPLKSRLSLQEHRTLFINLDEIHRASAVLMHAFQHLGSSPSSRDIGQTLLDNAPSLQPYIAYCGQQKRAADFLADKIATDRALADALKQLQSAPACKSLDLYSFLLLPMQRITRYSLLLKQIIHYADHSDHDVLLSALARVDEVAEAANEAARRTENRQKLAALQQSIGSLQAPPWAVDLTAPTRSLGERTLLYESPLVKVKSHRKLLGFLFNDLLLLCVSRGAKQKELLLYRPPMLLSSVTVRDVLPSDKEADRECTMAWHIPADPQSEEKESTTTVVMLLKAPSALIKRAWLDAIEQAQLLMAQKDSVAVHRSVQTVSSAVAYCGTLRVRLLAVDGLPTLRLGALPSPYCELQMDRQKHKTRVARASCASVFDQSFMFGVHSLDQTLNVTVFSYDPFTVDDYLGQVSVDLHVLEYYGEKETAPMTVDLDVAQGQITLALQYRSIA